MPDEYVPGETKKKTKKTPKQFKTGSDFDSYYQRTGKSAVDVSHKRKGKSLRNKKAAFKK